MPLCGPSCKFRLSMIWRWAECGNNVLYNSWNCMQYEGLQLLDRDYVGFSRFCIALPVSVWVSWTAVPVWYNLKWVNQPGTSPSQSAFNFPPWTFNWFFRAEKPPWNCSRVQFCHHTRKLTVKLLRYSVLCVRAEMAPCDCKGWKFWRGAISQISLRTEKPPQNFHGIQFYGTNFSLNRKASV